MANLLYLCPNPGLSESSLSYELASQMASCAHRVRLLTTYSAANEDLMAPKSVEFLMPFKSWSIFEMPKLVLGLTGFSPDIVHFFLNKEVPKSARLLLTTLPSFFRSVYNAKIVLHIEDQIPARSLSFSQWMHQADLVITKDHFQLLKTSALLESSPRQLLMALSSGKPVEATSKSFEWLKTWFDQFVFISGPVTKTDLAIAILKTCEYLMKENERLGLVMNIENLDGGLASEAILYAFLQDNFLEKQVVLLRSLSQEQSCELTTSCSYFFIAHLGLEPKQMSLALDTILSTDQVAICSAQQAFFIKSSCRQPLKVLECELSQPLIREIHQGYLTEGATESSSAFSLDRVNLLNRAYQQILV